MKVLNLALWDHANFAYDNMMSLRAAGVDCHGLKIEPHAFGYTKQLGIATKEEIHEAAKACDVIQIFHSSRPMLNLVKGLGKRLIVYHCSSDYRMKPAYMNSVFNPFVEKSVLCLGEFWGLGARNQVYAFGGIDCERVPVIHKTSGICFAHYPSNPQIKGTMQIVEACHDAGIELNWSLKQLPHEGQMIRLSGCDVYIELFKPVLNGKKYASFGITALEAARAGKIVVTQCDTVGLYERHYGKLPFVICNSYGHLVENLRSLSRWTPSEIYAKKVETQVWLLENHSYLAHGNYVKNNVLQWK